MIRNTSIEAYHANRKILNGLRWYVYEALAEASEPMTINEVYNERLGQFQQQSVSPRFAELHDLGLITIVGERPCNITGVNCKVWTTTKEIAVIKPKVKAKTDKQKIHEVLKYCEGFLDFMWGAQVVSILLDCDFKDAETELNKYYDKNR